MNKYLILLFLFFSMISHASEQIPSSNNLSGNYTKETFKTKSELTPIAEKNDSQLKFFSNKIFNTWTLSDKIAAITSLVALCQFLALIATVVIMSRTAGRQLRAYVFASPNYIFNFNENIPPLKLIVE